MILATDSGSDVEGEKVGKGVKQWGRPKLLRVP